MSEWTIKFPAPTQLMNMNDRFHWAKKAKLTDEWRQAAHWGCLLSKTPKNLPACTVTVHLPVKRRVRRDAMNYVATVKPIIDGLVDFGLWPDDDSEWVTVIEPVLVHTQEAGYDVTVVLRER